MAFPKCGGSLIPELELESSLSMCLSTVPRTLSSCTTWSGTGCSQGQISTIPWNSQVYWSWHIFHRAPWLFSVFIWRFQENKEMFSFDYQSHCHPYQNSSGRSIRCIEYWHWLKSPFWTSFSCQLDFSPRTALNFKQNNLYIFIFIIFIPKFVFKRWYSHHLKDIFFKSLKLISGSFLHISRVCCNT